MFSILYSVLSCKLSKIRIDVLYKQNTCTLHTFRRSLNTSSPFFLFVRFGAVSRILRTSRLFDFRSCATIRFGVALWVRRFSEVSLVDGLYGFVCCTCFTCCCEYSSACAMSIAFSIVSSSPTLISFSRTFSDDPREDAGGLSREYTLRIPSVS